MNGLNNGKLDTNRILNSVNFFLTIFTSTCSIADMQAPNRPLPPTPDDDDDEDEYCDRTLVIRRVSFQTRLSFSLSQHFQKVLFTYMGFPNCFQFEKQFD